MADSNDGQMALGCLVMLVAPVMLISRIFPDSPKKNPKEIPALKAGPLPSSTGTGIEPVEKSREKDKKPYER